jgi:hypothetical protein
VPDPALSSLPKQGQQLLGVSDEDPRTLLLWAFARAAISTRDVSLVTTLDTSVHTLRLDEPAADDSRFAMDGLAPSEALSEAAFAREAYLEWGVGHDHDAVVTLGKKRTLLLDGLFYDDYGTQAGIEWDAASFSGWTLALSAMELLPHHYFTTLTPETRISHVSVLLADVFDGFSAGALRFSDRTGVTASLVRNAIASDLMMDDKAGKGLVLSTFDLSGSVDLWTLYATARWTAWFLTLKVMAAWQDGTSRFSWTKPGTASEKGQPQAVQRKTDLSGTLLSLDVEVEALDALRLTPFLLRLSGSSVPQGDGLWKPDQFLTLAPSSDRLRIALGSASGLAADRDFRLLGTGGSGVMAWGIEAELSAMDGLNLSDTAALVGSCRPGDPLFNRNLGVENDFTALFEVVSGLALRVELDLLAPGAYFDASEWTVRGVGGVEGVF